MSARRATHSALPGLPPQRLAYILTPAAGEAWRSWIDRAAAAFDLPPGLLILAMGVPVRDETEVKPILAGTVLTPAARGALMVATGLDGPVLDATQLSRYDGAALDLSGIDRADETSVRTALRGQWMTAQSSRACPKCVAHSGVWNLWWRLGIAACCPHHRVLLVGTCPSCGIALRRGLAARSAGFSRTRVTDSRLCGNYSRGRVCEQSIGSIDTDPVSVRVAEVQQHVLRVADGASTPIVGTHFHSGDWFAALKFLAAMIRFARHPVITSRTTRQETRWATALSTQFADRASQGRRNPGDLRAMPDSPARAAAILLAADIVLGADSPEGCAAAIAELVAAADRRRRELRGHNPLAAMPVAAPLAAVLATLKPRGQHRICSAIPADVRPSGLSAHNVPQLFDAGDYAELLAPHLPGTAESTGRRFAAMAAVRLLGAHSWAHAGHLLEMDPGTAFRIGDVVVRRIGDPDQFWADLDIAVYRVADRERIDYRDRRRRLADLYDVPAIAIRAERGRDFPVTVARCRHGAGWAWARLTGGYVDDAPAYTRAWDIDIESVREGARRFARALPDTLAEQLLAWVAANFLETAR
ncbi:TniQ family protein [Nocardia salmonicida]|uniref:TniQ family protein n=1 Tax=Nocardia salmonicida TaxID=53431 RepID=UPI000A59D4F1|nr:TniQ family protein [Nocardia salmonicida]